MTPKEEHVAEDAIQYIKKHKKDIIRKFANPEIYPMAKNPVSVFMAGSPGAGKTEMSKSLVELFEIPTVRIDADEIRNEIPVYTGKNSAVVQGAASIGVEKIIDSCFKKGQSFILDGLLADFDKAKNNIERCLEKGRIVIIFYIYQDPKIAWEFTQKREKLEGRNIPKEAFVHGFIYSRSVVQKLKDEYGKSIQLHVIEKDFHNGNKEVWADVKDIDKYIKKRYSVQTLKELLY